MLHLLIGADQCIIIWFIEINIYDKNYKIICEKSLRLL